MGAMKNEYMHMLNVEMQGPPMHDPEYKELVQKQLTRLYTATKIVLTMINRSEQTTYELKNMTYELQDKMCELENKLMDWEV